MLDSGLNRFQLPERVLRESHVLHAGSVLDPFTIEIRLETPEHAALPVRVENQPAPRLRTPGPMRTGGALARRR